MPIVRTYACPDCGHFLDVTLTLEQADDPPPDCPHCAEPSMRQEFKPIAIGGSDAGKAHKLAETIAEQDYGVADISSRGFGEAAKVRYKETRTAQPSTWGATAEMLNTAIASGRQLRQAGHGTGMDVLQGALKSGAQPDLIKLSKQKLLRAT